MPQPPDIESQPNKSSNLPEIPMDGTEEVVKRLLDAMTSDDLPMCEWPTNIAATTLAVQLECPVVRDRLIAGIFEYPQFIEGWTVFKAFAQLEHPSAAKRALRLLVSRSAHAADWSLEDMRLIPPPYLLGLLRASRARAQIGDWVEIGNRFAPATFQEG